MMSRRMSVLLFALLLCVGCGGRSQLSVETSVPRDIASFDRTIDSLQTIAVSKPTDSEVLNQLGMLHYEKAKWMYETMKYRVDFQMQKNRGRIEAGADKAMRTLDEVTRAKPDRADTYKNKAMVCILRNEWEQNEERYTGNLREALKLLQRADSLQPESSQIWYWRGVTNSRFHRRMGEVEAARCFEKALQLDSANAKAAFARADLYTWMGGAFDSRVLELYACVARAEPKDVELLRDEGDLYGWMIWSADRVYWESLRSIPSLIKPMVMLGLRIFGRTSKVTEIREEIVRHGMANADDYWTLVDSYSGNTRKTLEVFKRLLAVSNYAVPTGSPYGGGDLLDELFYKDATKLEPSLAWIYFYHGKYAWGERAQEGRSHLLKAIELDPGLTLAYYLVGVCYVEQEDYGNAIPWLKLAIERKPTDEFAAINAHQLLSLIYLNKGEVKTAIEEFRNAMKIDSSFAAWNCRYKLFGRGRGGIPYLPEKPIASDALLGHDDKKVASMLNALSSWVYESPGVGPFNYYLQNARRDIISKGKQEEFLKSAIELDPDNEEAYLRLATHYEFSTRQRTNVDITTGKHYTVTPISKVDEAIKVLQLFLNRHPESRKAHFQLGQYYTQKKLFGKAEEEYKSAARLGSPLALYELERMGQYR